MKKEFAFILVLFFVSLVSAADPSLKLKFTEGQQLCQERKGMYIVQHNKEACFDPSKGVVNGGFSLIHFNEGIRPPELPAEKDDFDMISGKPIQFYRYFEELNEVTVCNYSNKELAVRWSSMDAMNPPTRPQAGILTGKCKSNGTHMFSLYPDINNIEPFWKDFESLEKQKEARRARKEERDHKEISHVDPSVDKVAK